MDFETGEDYQDRETGEAPASPKLNSETGEPEMNCVKPEQNYTKKPFKIPHNYIIDNTNSLTEEEFNKITAALDFGDGIVPKSDLSDAIVFLLPSVVFFHPILLVVLGIIELLLHKWAHYKNRYLRDSHIFYQSPLHIVTSEFCAKCRESKMKKQFTKLQDKRIDRFTKYGIEYVRRIVT